jgi:RNA polymerase sigma factor (TIGR02999 family)
MCGPARATEDLNTRSPAHGGGLFVTQVPVWSLARVHPNMRKIGRELRTAAAEPVVDARVAMTNNRPDAQRLGRARTSRYGVMSKSRISDLLAGSTRGDKRAVDELTVLLYSELHAIATAFLNRERPGHTLQPTALIHDTYVRLVGSQDVSWKGRTHFLGYSARVMRQILVDHARARAADKRGGGAVRVELDEAVWAAPMRDVDTIALDRVLTELERLDEQHARIVELKVFGGLTNKEIAEHLGIGQAAVRRAWTACRMWLRRELGAGRRS